MKVCLGMIFKNEEQMLTRNLNIVSKSFDGAVFLDDNSTDNSEMVVDCNCRCDFDIIKPETQVKSFAEKRNMVIRWAEKLKYDAIIFLDADEVMFPSDINLIRETLENENAIALPRYEFGPDFTHYNPTLYPDFQGRAFKLGLGYQYRNEVHEILYQGKSLLSVYENDGFHFLGDVHIFHYGRCKDPKIIWTRYNNYAEMLKGLDPTNTEPPKDIDLNYVFKDVKEFKGEQPCLG